MMFKDYKIILFDYLEKLIRPEPLVIILVLLLLAGLFMVLRKKTVFNTRSLTYGALAIAASFVLYYLKILQLPTGGSISIAGMLPLFLLAWIAGPRVAIAAGFCFGLIHYMQEPFFVHWAQFLLDYPLASASLGLAGLFRKNIYAGAVVGGLGNLFMHFLSGVVFFASYAGDQNVFLYSLIYNSSYTIPELAICLIIMALPGMRSMVERLKNMAPVSTGQQV